MDTTAEMITEVTACDECGSGICLVDGFPEEASSDGTPAGVEHECGSEANVAYDG